MKIQSVLALVLCVALFPQRAFSWADEGHSIVALIAEKSLAEQAKKSPSARKALDTVKKILGKTKFDEAAVWPDKVRTTARDCVTAPYVKDPTYKNPNSSALCDAYSYTASWHYANSDTSKYVIDQASKDYYKGDIVVMLNGLVHTLKGEQAPLLAGVTSFDNWKAACLKKADHNCKKEALQFLIHFVGDIHQPLHAGASCDLGGNNQQTRFFGKDVDPSAIWCEPRKPKDPKDPRYAYDLKNYNNCIQHEIHQDWDYGLLVAAPKTKYKSNKSYVGYVTKQLSKATESSDADHCVKVAPTATVQVDGSNGPLDWINESLCYVPQAYKFPDDPSAVANSKDKKDEKRKVAEQTLPNRCAVDRAEKAVDENGQVILNKDGTERIAFFKPYEIGAKYYATNSKTVDERIYWGGVRLANLLVDIYGNGDKAPDFDK